MSAPVEVSLQRDDALLVVRLARPKANLIDAAMIAALTEALEAHRGRSGLRGLLLTSAGPHFSFGASVEEHLPTHCAEMLRSLHALLNVLLAWPTPTLVAIRGQCLGGGLELALACSLRFASGDARLGQPEIKLGVFAPAASVLLPHCVGAAHAEDLLTTGRVLSAVEALSIGLVQRVEAAPEAAAMAYFDAHLMGLSAASLARAVTAARLQRRLAVSNLLTELETFYLEDLMKTRDATEGLTAFLEKRQPVWEHR